MTSDKDDSVVATAINKSDESGGEEDGLDERRKKMQKLIDLLLCSSLEFDESKFMNQLDDYLTHYDRLMYSEITAKVHKKIKNNGGDESEVTTNIDALCDKCLRDDNMVKNRRTKIILKICDHINLVSTQTQYSDNRIRQVETRTEIASNKLNNIKNDLETIRTSIYAQLISIVAIFVAISFVMFGGMSLMNNLFDFSNMTAVPLTELFGIGALIGVVMLLIIYMFLHFILYLTKGEDGEKDKSRVISKQAFWGSIVVLSIIAIACVIISRVL